MGIATLVNKDGGWCTQVDLKIGLKGDTSLGGKICRQNNG